MRKTIRTWAVCISAILLAASVPMTSLAGSWQQDARGWWYQNDNGSYAVSQWEHIGGVWYLFGSDGYMMTGWQEVDGKWYYLDRVTGAMSHDASVDGYYLGSDGARLGYTADMNLQEPPNFYFFPQETAIESCETFTSTVRNSGSKDLIFYSKKAGLIDYTDDSYNRFLTFCQQDSATKQLTDVASITVKPGETAYPIMRIQGERSRYDSSSWIFCYYEYDNQLYVLSANGNLGNPFGIQPADTLGTSMKDIK